MHVEMLQPEHFLDPLVMTNVAIEHGPVEI